MFKRLRSVFRVLTRRRDFEDGMSEELRFHIEQYTDDLVRSGMSREKADRQIRMELGSATNIKADCRETYYLPSPWTANKEWPNIRQFRPSYELLGS